MALPGMYLQTFGTIDMIIDHQTQRIKNELQVARDEYLKFQFLHKKILLNFAINLTSPKPNFNN